MSRLTKQTNQHTGQLHNASPPKATEPHGTPPHQDRLRPCMEARTTLQHAVGSKRSAWMQKRRLDAGCAPPHRQGQHETHHTTTPCKPHWDTACPHICTHPPGHTRTQTLHHTPAQPKKSTVRTRQTPTTVVAGKECHETHHTHLKHPNTPLQITHRTACPDCTACPLSRGHSALHNLPAD
jgi:hypothetical protein